MAYLKQRAMQAGFTLLELLMVVVLIAILASIALPQFLRVAERGRMAEGLNMLGAMRGSETRFRAETGVFTDDPTKLDVNEADMAGTKHYALAASIAGGAGKFLITATRNGTEFNSGSSCKAGYVLCIRETGQVQGRDCQQDPGVCTP